MIINAVFFALGAFLSWYFTWRYFKKAAKDSAEIIRQNELMLAAISASGLAELILDDKGKFRQVAYTLKIADSTIKVTSGSPILIGQEAGAPKGPGVKDAG